MRVILDISEEDSVGVTSNLEEAKSLREKAIEQLLFHLECGISMLSEELRKRKTESK